MRVPVLAAAALMLASCTTPNMPTNTTGAGPQASNTATEPRDAPVPPALRSPRQQSGVGWPDIGYQPYGR